MNDNERKYLESRIRSLDKAIKTYGQRISEHQEKLKAYKNNPEATDLKGGQNKLKDRLYKVHSS